ncbi:glycosyltransferase family 4 protein [Janibacter hoylei]|uniref:glycosyltransferase family 4 protein n=1 Tax=Janibacter hoylei TaxID=364298 RepID=UPI002493997B|nr:glycosyltransferase family 1 protein [Janibacter hoylei]
MVHVVFPSRIIDRHVGGNTTYAREIRDGLLARGHEVSTMPMAPHPALTAALETGRGWVGPSDRLVHYSADTGPLLPTRLPSVVTVHGVASRWIGSARTSRQEAVWRARVRAAIRGTRAIITVSESAADDISAVFGVDRESIDIILHGIDVEQFETPTPLSRALSAAVPEEYVLYLGNIEPRKNLMPLVRAFQQPPLRDLGIPLVIAGKPAWNFAESMAEIEAAPNVHHLGFVSDADRVALMQGAALFAFPSLYEGFGFPVLEAMAAGTPVATTRRGSLAEVAGPAWLLEEVDPESLGREIAAALQDRTWRAEVVAEGRRWARRFTWDSSVQRHIDVYERVLGS